MDPKYSDIKGLHCTLVNRVNLDGRTQNVVHITRVHTICTEKQIQTSLRLISVSLSNVLYCIYDVSVVSLCTLYLNKILFTLDVTFLHTG